MEIAFIVQNLAHASDSVGYDCVFQYRIAKRNFGGAGSVRLFANVFDQSLHPDVNIESFERFVPFIMENPEAIVVYHFCDGWERVDEFLIANVKNCYIRWHNNTPPWFYVLDSLDFASGGTRGFRVMTQFARAPNVRFMVNSDFTRRQLQALDGSPEKIFTVFPISPFLNKPRMTAPPDQRRVDQDASPELLFVGRVVPHKGHHHILSVAAMVQRYLGKPVRVTFAGSLEDRLKYYWEGLAAAAQKLNLELVMTGLIGDDDLSALYGRSNVFVCMSEHEGFGMPVFEAMRLHVPVVAWASSAFSDLLAEHPLASAQFDLPRFAASVIVALDDKFRESILKSQEAELQTYTFEVVEGQFLGAINGSDPGGLSAPPDARRTGRKAVSHASISKAVDEIAASIQRSLDGVERVNHDASINYVGLYDIDVYERLIALLRGEFHPRPAAPVELNGTELDALHERHAVIRSVVSGSAPYHVGDLTISDLNRFDDWIFVKLAYALARNREPQRFELVRELRHLRAGHGKTELLRQLADGADAARVVQSDAMARTQSTIGRLEENVARLTRFLNNAPANGEISNPVEAIQHVDDLLRLKDPAFVQEAYKAVLGRPADAGGIDHYLNALKHGLTRKATLRHLANSEEGRRNPNHLEGLAEYVDGEVGDAEALLRRLNRLENSVGRLVSQLVINPPSAASAGPLIEETPELPLAKLRQYSHDVEALTGAASGDPFPNRPIVMVNGRAAIFNIHQILIAADGKIPKSLPATVQRNIESLRQHHPDAHYKLWSESELRVVIAENFEPEVLDAFDTLTAFALKADLARYCLLYVYGGLYSDINNRFLNPLVIEPGKVLSCFREHRSLHGAVWMCQNTIIYAEPKQPEMKLAIELVVRNVRNHDYGVSSLAPSGPVLLGRVLGALGRADLYQIGVSINLEVDGALNRSVYVYDDGTILAARMQGGGGTPSEMGLRGTNIYGKMWDQREIYGEKAFVFTHDHTAINTHCERVREGIYIPSTARHIQIFGPYLPLDRGSYRATIIFAKFNEEGSVTIDVCARLGYEILAVENNVSLDASGRATIFFDLTEKYDDVEIRTWVNDGFSGYFQQLRITKESDEPLSMSEQTALEKAGDAALAEPRSNIRCVHHILELDRATGRPVLTLDASLNLATVRDLHPDAEPVIWTPDSVRSFVAETFSPDVLDAYDRILPGKMKSELARYCLLFAIGGLYADVGVRFVNPLILPPDRVLACFRRAQPAAGAAWAVDPGVLAAERGQPEFRDAIDAICANVREGFYGASSSSPAGADLLGRSLALHYRASRYYAGDVVPLTRGFAKWNECYVSLDGKLIAVRMPDPDTSAASPIRAQDELERAWRERRLYREAPIQIERQGERHHPEAGEPLRSRRRQVELDMASADSEALDLTVLTSRIINETVG